MIPDKYAIYRPVLKFVTDRLEEYLGSFVLFEEQ